MTGPEGIIPGLGTELESNGGLGIRIVELSPVKPQFHTETLLPVEVCIVTSGGGADGSRV